jgi:hypothetical protein
MIGSRPPRRTTQGKAGSWICATFSRSVLWTVYRSVMAVAVPIHDTSGDWTSIASQARISSVARPQSATCLTQAIAETLVAGLVASREKNAASSSISSSRNRRSSVAAEAKPLPAIEKRKKQFQNLKSRIGEYLPSDASAYDMTSDRLPIVISRSFGAAALKAIPVSGENVFCPLWIVRYADGEQMLSITGTLVARDDRDAFLGRLDLRS